MCMHNKKIGDILNEMKKIIIILIALVLLAVVVKGPVMKLVSTNLVLNSRIAAITDKIEGAFSGLAYIPEGISEEYRKLRVAAARMLGGFRNIPLLMTKDREWVRLHLKHGGVITGPLLGKNADSYTVLWDDKKFTINKRQVKKFEEVTQKDLEWPYKNDVVVKRNNGIILDGEIIDVKGDEMTMRFTEGGGDLEMTIKRSEIANLMFAPVFNKESQDIEDALKTQFPKMKVYREGNITLLTDSFDTWVKLYKGTLIREYTDIYLKFFKLFKGRKPRTQNFIVLFDDIYDYAEYAITDGVPFWSVIGYFKPTDKTIYLFNAFGRKVEQMVFDVIVGKTGKSVDQIVNAVKKNVDQRYHIFIDGQAKELTDRYWNVYGIYRTNLTDRTVSTLRHEFVHELFNSWGLQDVLMSSPNIDRKKMAAKKKEFLDAKTWREKEKRLLVLMKMEKEGSEGLEIVASNSWLGEGMATYCETDPIGGTNNEWLFVFQESQKEGAVNPIEFLTSFKKGSFSGLSHEGVINSYAQSWALTTFLIDKYPDQFMEYQKRMSELKPEDGTDEMALLLKSLNKDLPTLEKEFGEFMKAYPKVEDPDVKGFMELYNVWRDLIE